jgi:hypothetical protein
MPLILLKAFATLILSGFAFYMLHLMLAEPPTPILIVYIGGVVGALIAIFLVWGDPSKKSQSPAH